jgi:hypothetical protein
VKDLLRLSQVAMEMAQQQLVVRLMKDHLLAVRPEI